MPAPGSGPEQVSVAGREFAPADERLDLGPEGFAPAPGLSGEGRAPRLRNPCHGAQGFGKMISSLMGAGSLLLPHSGFSFFTIF